VSESVNKQGFLFYLTAILLIFSFGLQAQVASPHQKQYIYDHAQLLTDQEKADLEALSRELGEERQAAFLIITLNGTGEKDIVKYVEDFYDQEAPGYEGPHGNTAILAIDLQERDVYLAGFGKAEEYLDDGRLDQIRGKITPDLSAGRYFQAFSTFIATSVDYMGYEPGVNPENILFKWWFQLAASFILAGVIVGLMAYRSGGRVTVNAQTYMNHQQSKILNQKDQYVRQTVTKRKKPSNNPKGGGGGGGITGGGFSHSGSRGKF